MPITNAKRQKVEPTIVELRLCPKCSLYGVVAIGVYNPYDACLKCGWHEPYPEVKRGSDAGLQQGTEEGTGTKQGD